MTTRDVKRSRCASPALCYVIWRPLLPRRHLRKREREGEKEGDVFCLFQKIWVNELASSRNCKDLCPVAADGQKLSSKGHGSRENQTGRDRQTDRQTQRQRWMPVPTEVQARCMSSFHWSLLPLRGCVCIGLCHRGRRLQSLHRRNALGQFCLNKDRSI